MKSNNHLKFRVGGTTILHVDALLNTTFILGVYLIVLLLADTYANFPLDK